MQRCSLNVNTAHTNTRGMSGRSPKSGGTMDTHGPGSTGGDSSPATKNPKSAERVDKGKAPAAEQSDGE